MIGFCSLVQPNYMPRLSLEEIDRKQVLVIWVPAGSNRPYKVPDDVLARHKTTITESASIQGINYVLILQGLVPLERRGGQMKKVEQRAEG